MKLFYTLKRKNVHADGNAKLFTRYTYPFELFTADTALKIVVSYWSNISFVMHNAIAQ